MSPSPGRPRWISDDASPWLLQDPLLLDRSVFENVAAGLRFRHVAPDEVRRRTDAWLHKLSIHHLRGSAGAETLGRGERSG